MSDQAAAEIPRLAFPFRMSRLGNSFGAAVVDQDSLDDVVASVYAVLATPLGSREDEPTFGFEDPSFYGADLDDIRSVVEEWEPRATLLTDSQLEGVVQTVQVQVS